MLKRSCGRTVSRNLAEFMCESSTLRTVEIDGGGELRASSAFMKTSSHCLQKRETNLR